MLLRNVFLTVLVCVITAGVSMAFAANDGIEQKVLSQIRASYRAICSDCRFEFKQLRIPELNTKSSEDVQVITDGITWAGSFLLPLEVSGNRVGWISGQVKIFQQGLLARRGLQPGDSLSPADVEKEWIDVTFIKDQLASMADLARLTPKKFLGIRQPIVMSDLRKIIVVQRGQTVKISLGEGDFEITTSMKAEDSGSIGDLIRVKNVETQKILSARVEKEGSARVE